jgi:hypothetical protein
MAYAELVGVPATATAISGTLALVTSGLRGFFGGQPIGIDCRLAVVPRTAGVPQRLADRDGCQPSLRAWWLLRLGRYAGRADLGRRGRRC